MILVGVNSPVRKINTRLCRHLVHQKQNLMNLSPVVEVSTMAPSTYMTAKLAAGHVMCMAELATGPVISMAELAAILLFTGATNEDVLQGHVRR
jgi:hypothetical protein